MPRKSLPSVNSVQIRETPHFSGVTGRCCPLVWLGKPVWSRARRARNKRLEMTPEVHFIIVQFLKENECKLKISLFKFLYAATIVTLHCHTSQVKACLS